MLEFNIFYANLGVPSRWFPDHKMFVDEYSYRHFIRPMENLGVDVDRLEEIKAQYTQFVKYVPYLEGFKHTYKEWDYIMKPICKSLEYRIDV